MVGNEPRSKTTFGMSLALPQGARQPWHRLQTEGTREKEHSASSCGLPTPLLPCVGMPQAMERWNSGRSSRRAPAGALPYRCLEPCSTAQMLSLAAPAGFRTRRVSRSKRGMASKARKHRCWEIQEGGSPGVFKCVAA